MATTRPCRGNHVCSIIPPHLLTAIAGNPEADQHAREAANHTLLLTQSLTNERQSFAASLAGGGGGSAPPPQGILPPHILQNIADSDDADPEARAAAQQSLTHTQGLRSEREAQEDSLAPTKKKKPTSGAATLNRLIYTAAHKTRLPGTIQRKEGEAPTSDDSVNEAYDGLGDTFNFYSDVFHRNSIDDKGLDLIGTVHYGSKYNNAFWNGSQMVFGDGDGVYFSRFTISVDVIGHELTHGVTSYTANLDYQGESGALNESVSDVFGSMVKQYHLKQTSEEADWLIGEGLFTKAVNGVALRSMKAPGTAYDDKVIGKDPQPADYANITITDDDNGGVHINSGIPNRAFFLTAIALGGRSWDKAGPIWYATLNDSSLAPDADFKTFAALTIKNASKLYGDEAKAAVTEAWKTVKVPVEDSA